MSTGEAPTMLLGDETFRGKMEPAELEQLQKLFDECLRRLGTVYGADPEQLEIRLRLVATRIMQLTDFGMRDQKHLKKAALVGLLPKSRLSSGGRRQSSLTK